MTSPELSRELRGTRPTAPPSLRDHVRQIAARDAARAGHLPFRFTVRRGTLFALPAAAALALVTAGVVGLAHSGRPPAGSQQALQAARPQPRAVPGTSTGVSGSGLLAPAAPLPTGIAPTPGRAERVAATLTVRVPSSDEVANAAQQALVVTRSLGGHVVSASVATGSDATASLTVRVPVASVQEAIVRLSSLGRIVSQQVSIDDLQESLDALSRRAASVRAQIVHISALLESGSLGPVARATLEARRSALRSQLRALQRQIVSTSADARFATVQLTVATPSSLGVVVPQSRFDRTVDGAVDVLVWEGLGALAVLVVALPLGLLAVGVWLLRRAARKREDDRLLAAS